MLEREVWFSSVGYLSRRDLPGILPAQNLPQPHMSMRDLQSFAERSLATAQLNR